MVIVQIVERNKGEAQRTWWQMRIPDHFDLLESIELLTKSVLGVIKKMARS